MRIALVYDCLYPNTVGGAERWYRNLGERLAGTHEVVYLTRRQWGGEGPGTPFETVAVSPGGDLYTRSGRRRIGPPLRFGWGVFRHLLRHGRRYDAVHTASFPYFSVLAAWAALRLRRSRAVLVVDWHELWGREYWRSYLGPIAGSIGHAVQSLCLRMAERSFCFSRGVERRLLAAGRHGRSAGAASQTGRAVVRLTGEFAGPRPGGGEPCLEPPAQPLVVFAGRHIPEKHVTDVPAAVAEARRELPELRCAILGDGPENEAVRAAVAELGLEEAVEVRGRIAGAEVEHTIAAASCLLHPSEREGYGLVVVEAAYLGTPAIVVAGEENAATELVEDGVNGFVAASRDPAELTRAILAAVRGGAALRRSTREWYERNRRALSIESSLELVEACYRSTSGEGSP
jgi:glycosyltransferase involved in cell wall biosynthesis